MKRSNKSVRTSTPDSLLIDIDSGPKDFGSVEITGGLCDLWISETEPGGGGIIERFLPEIAEAPRRFLDLTKSALAAGDFEQADRELSRFLDELILPAVQSAELIAVVDCVRSAQALDERLQNFDSTSVDHGQIWICHQSRRDCRAELKNSETRKQPED